MKTSVLTVAAVLLAGTAHAQAQTAPQNPPAAGRSASDLTRDLNSRPPTIEEYLARPATASPAPAVPTPRPAPATSAPAAPTSAPATAPARTTPAPTASATSSPATPATSAPARAAPTRAPVPAPATPAASGAPRTTGPATPAPRPAAAPPPSVRPAAPAPRPEEEVDDATVETPAAAAPAPPRAAPLNAAARAALPFTVDLPAGFEIVAAPSPPDAGIYRVSRGEQSFVMIYAGPASQFPIYGGEMVEAGGRASVVVTEGGARHAVEHLFERSSGAPREIHVWTMTLDGADRALAEQIAQSVDVR